MGDSIPVLMNAALSRGALLLLKWLQSECCHPGTSLPSNSPLQDDLNSGKLISSLPLPSYFTIRVQLVVLCVVPAVAITWKVYVPAGVLFEVDDEELPPQPNGSKVKPASTRIIQ